MKKFFVSGLMVMSIGCLGAQQLKIITSETEMYQFGGQQAFALSDNGRYVVGSTMTSHCFIYDSENESTVVFTEERGSSVSTSGGELRAVNNEGVAVGFDDNGGIMVNAEGVYNIIEPAAGLIKMVMCYDITDDSKLIVGSVADASWAEVPCYWEDGKRIMLPYPTTEEAGFRVNGCRAISVSDDGSVIMGEIIDRSQMLPLLIWKRQADGSYKYFNAWEKYYEPVYNPVYDDDKLVGFEKGDHPYLRFEPGAMSADGKTMAMYIYENVDDLNPPLLLGYYDIETEEVTVVPVENHAFFDYYGTFIIRGVSNEGTIFGTAGALALGTQPFIMYRDEMIPKSLEEAFPEVGEFQTFYDTMLEGMPSNIVS